MSKIPVLVLDNRTTGDWLDYFYSYCQHIPYAQGANGDEITLVPNPALASYEVTTSAIDKGEKFSEDTEGAIIAGCLESKLSVRVRLCNDNWSNNYYLPNAPEYYDKVVTFTSTAGSKSTIHDGDNDWVIHDDEELTFRYMAGAWSPYKALSWTDVFFDSNYNSEEPQDKRLNVAKLTELAGTLNTANGSLNTADGTLAPIQAFLLAFLKMQQTPRALFNSLAYRHRQLYYRDLLGLTPSPVLADNVMVSFALQDDVPELYLPQDTLLDAGTDSEGNERQYTLQQGLLTNQVRWTDLRWTDYSDVADPTAYTAFDESAGVNWPDSGLRLFDSSAATPGDSATILPGRVVSSPLLALAGGTRTIKVVFAESLAMPVDVTGYVSSASGWLTLVTTGTGFTGDRLTFTIDASVGAIEANPDLDGFIETEPLLKIVSNNPDTAIPEIVSIATSVVNMPNVFMSTDDGLEDINKQVEPFGLEPVVGARINLVAEEWLGKTNIVIRLTPSWMDLPDKSFQSHYVNYPSVDNISNNNIFQASAAISHNGVLGDMLNTPVDTRSVAAHVDEGGANLFKTGISAPDANPLNITTDFLTGEVVDSEDPRDWSSWLTLTLTPQDFLHGEYWTLMANPPTEPLEPPLNPPYTPQWQQCQVDVDYGTDDLTGESSAQYILTPFGYTDTTDDLTGESSAQYILTPFGYTDTTEDANPAGQQLYLGFTDITPGQDLLLHWQLKSPSEPTVVWDYLNQQNQWVSLDAFCNDQTAQLFHSGLWSVTLPDDTSIASSRDDTASAPNASRMPSGRAWLRASVSTTADDVTDGIATTPWLYGVNTNCGTAIRIINPDSVYDGVLPANTIAQTTEAITNLDAVMQPWESVGGRAGETNQDFNDRAAKQLSHRNRALNWREIRDILLEYFPELMDARHESANNISSSFSYGPPNPNMTVLPRVGQQDNDDSLRPKFNNARLTKMQDYILARSTPWLKLALKNPNYRDILVKYQLTFSAGVNQYYGYQQVKEALAQQYMPWAWDENSQLSVGISLDYYNMVSFIQQLDYVASVDSLQLNGATSSVQAEGNDVLILTDTPNANAQYLVIKRLGTNDGGDFVLSLANVEVISDGENVATDSLVVASESSVYLGEDTYSASKAIDIDTGTFSSTKDEKGSYWSLDLQSVKTIESIVLTSRNSPDGVQLTNFSITLLAADNKTVQWHRDCYINHNGHPNPTLEIDFTLDENGHLLDVKVTGDGTP